MLTVAVPMCDIKHMYCKIIMTCHHQQQQAAVTRLPFEATIYIVDCRGDHKWCKDNTRIPIGSVML